jgi:hypothetical protein
MNEDDRAKMVMDRNRPLTLEEQKYEMEKEKQKKKQEEASYKSRSGADVATWISYLDDQKKKIYQTYGAHLGGTNVTRDKINQEAVRRKHTENARTYHDELAQQIEEQKRNIQLHKLKNDVAGIEHAKRWDAWVLFFKNKMHIFFEKDF